MKTCLKVLLIILLTLLAAFVSCTQYDDKLEEKINNQFNALISIQSGKTYADTNYRIKSVSDLFALYRDYFGNVATSLSKSENADLILKLRKMTSGLLFFDDKCAEIAAEKMQNLYDGMKKKEGEFDFGLQCVELSDLSESETVINILYSDCRAFSTMKVSDDDCAPQNAFAKIVLYDAKISSEWLSKYKTGEYISLESDMDNHRIGYSAYFGDDHDVVLYLIAYGKMTVAEQVNTELVLPVGIISIPVFAE